ncbi:hypothetical protein EJB05_01723 [Eragrostis curvula]|uniref:Uncharacterized protein n=1 Tax=Eragrostis curvula TaxID=38414 RepID=A0A5J9WST2_9POAL|nr:hypothetical protein EJB05_01723 [Eragrostis curvula]
MVIRLLWNIGRRFNMPVSKSQFCMILTPGATPGVPASSLGFGRHMYQESVKVEMAPVLTLSEP